MQTEEFLSPMLKPRETHPSCDCVHCSMKLSGSLIDPAANPLTMHQPIEPNRETPR